MQRPGNSLMGNALREVVRCASRVAHTSFRAVGGFNWIAKSPWRRQRLLILCYHGVSLQDEHQWRPGLFVTTDHLRRRFSLLREVGCEVLPLGEAVRRLHGGLLPPRSVALTFDDGFYNFFAAAMPLLKEFGYPVTVYMSTYHCIHQRPILRLAIGYLLWRARSQMLPAGGFPGQDDAINLLEAWQREKLAKKLVDEARVLSDDREAQQAWLGQLAARLGIDWDDVLRSRILHLMTGEEVANLARQGVDVQLHTHRHRTPREQSAFRHEVLENRRVLEELTGRSATHFCYPSGDVDPVFLPWLRDLDVETATTCSVDLARAEHDPLLLPRYVDTMAHSEVMFESWLSGTAAILRRKSSRIAC